MSTDIAYKIKTSATGGDGKPLKFQSFDRARTVQRLAEVQRLDPKARMLGIPVAGR